MKPSTFRTFLAVGVIAALLPAFAPSWAQDAQSQAPTKKGGQKGGQKAAPKLDKPQAPEVLPGKGLAQHDFLFVGQQAFREKGVQLIKGGKVAWSYNDPQGQGELSDASVLPNGNVLFTHAYGVRVVNPAKQIVWRYDVKGEEHEIHGAQAIGNDRVIFLQTANPTAKILVANIAANKIEKEFEIPLGKDANMKEPRYVHMQMRRLRLTPAGTVVIAYTNANEVAEYDESGKKIWSASVDRPWSVERLKNGNTIACLTKMEVVELDKQGKVIWSFSKDDAEKQGYVMTKWQVATRLADGNTIINNEVSWSPSQSAENWAPVQALEVSPDKKIVWALRDHSLGRATTIHVLDDANMNPKGAHFGSIK